jgi:hypothetical protein
MNGAASGHNRNFRWLHGVLEDLCDHGMSGFVVRGHAFELGGQNQAWALEAEGDLVKGAGEVWIANRGFAQPCRLERGFVRQVFQVSAAHAWGHLGQAEDIDARFDGFVLQVNVHDRFAFFQGRQSDGHLTVETARTQQRMIKNVWSVCCRHDDHAGGFVEAIHLGQDLIEGLFAFVVPAADACAALASNRVQLVDKDDRGAGFACILEQTAHSRCANADEHFHEFRG